MRIRLFGVLTILVMALSPALAADEATDEATLDLIGEVPSLVRIGFGTVGEQGHEFDFGDLTDTGSQDIEVVYLGNVTYSIDVESTNAGELKHTDAGENGDFKTAIGYTFTWDEDEFELSEGAANVIDSQSRGIGSAMVEIEVDDISLEDIDSDTPEEEIAAQGTYEDDLTFTITAEE